MSDCNFKVGDKVKCISVCGGATFAVGQVYTIKRIYYNNFVEALDEYGRTHTGMFAHRFQLVNESTATDQELADEYRRLTNEAYALANTLQSRGYRITTPQGMICPHLVRDRRIFKTETKTIEL